MRVPHPDHQAEIVGIVAALDFEKPEVAIAFMAQCMGLVDDLQPVVLQRFLHLVQKDRVGNGIPGLGSLGGRNCAHTSKKQSNLLKKVPSTSSTAIATETAIFGPS